MGRRAKYIHNHNHIALNLNFIADGSKHLVDSVDHA